MNVFNRLISLLLIIALLNTNFTVYAHESLLEEDDVSRIVNRCRQNGESEESLQAEINRHADWARMGAALTALVTGQDVNIAIQTATNAVESDYIWRYTQQKSLTSNISEPKANTSTDLKIYDALMAAGASEEEAHFILTHPELKDLAHQGKFFQRAAEEGAFYEKLPREAFSEQIYYDNYEYDRRQYEKYEYERIKSFEDDQNEPVDKNQLSSCKPLMRPNSFLEEAINLSQKGAVTLNQFAQEHPSLAKYAVISMQVAMGGPVRYLAHEAAHHLVGDEVEAVKQAGVTYLVGQLNVAKRDVEVVSSALGFGLGLVVSKVKAVFKDAQQVSKAVAKREGVLTRDTRKTPANDNGRPINDNRQVIAEPAHLQAVGQNIRPSSGMSNASKPQASRNIGSNKAPSTSQTPTTRGSTQSTNTMQSGMSNEKTLKANELFKSVQKNDVQKVHKNSNTYEGPTHLYRILDKNKKTYKIGESAQGVRKRDGASIRAEAQARKLQRQTGEKYRTEIRKKFETKREARVYENKAIKKFKKIYGDTSLPGNKVDR